MTDQAAADEVIHEIPGVVQFVVVPNGTPLSEDERRFGTFLRGFCAGAIFEHRSAAASSSGRNQDAAATFEATP